MHLNFGENQIALEGEAREDLLEVAMLIVHSVQGTNCDASANPTGIQLTDSPKFSVQTKLR